MKTCLILILLLSIPFGTQAQTIPASKAPYYNWIYLTNSDRVLKGVILATSDSSVQFIDKSFLKKGKVVASQLQVIPVSTIKSIKYRKRRATTDGAILGALGGMLTGAIVGFTQGDDRCEPGTFCLSIISPEEAAGIGALLGLIPGIGMGILLSSDRETIYLNGDQGTYNLTRDELKKYSLTGN